MSELKSFLPGWKTVRLIGSGGFGKVYEIEKDDETRMRSALKVITIPQSEEEYRNYEYEGYNEESITAILKDQVESVVAEYTTMSQFKGTSNIVSCEDANVIPHDDGKGWDILIRMELLTPLLEYLMNHTMTETEVAKLGKDICSALDLCSRHNIIHRDIKPQNIFINKHGDYKLGDFGIAKTMDHTTQGTKTGTFTYMAPEVYNNKPYNSSADIYSLGLVLYWLLNEKRLPFLPLPPQTPSANEKNAAQARRLAGEPLPEPQNGSNELKQIILKSIQYNPQYRFASAAEMRNALEWISKKKPENTSQHNNSEVRFANVNTPQGDESADYSDYTQGTVKEIPKAGVRCQKCGSEITNNNKFCTNCGAPVEQPGTQPNVINNNEASQSSHKGSSSIGRVLGIVLVASLFFLAGKGLSGYLVKPSNQPSSTPSEVVKEEATQPTGEDASNYVKAMMDVICKGDYERDTVTFDDIEDAELLKMREESLDEAVELIFPAGDVNDEVKEEFRSVFDLAGKKANYTVGVAVPRFGDGLDITGYEVPVTISPLRVYEGYSEEALEELLNERISEEFDAPESFWSKPESERYNYILLLAAELTKKGLDDPKYDEAQVVKVNYELLDEEANMWGVSEEEGGKLGMAIFADEGF